MSNTTINPFVRQMRETVATLRSQPGLDSLLAQADPEAPLAERVHWAVDLLAWVRRDVPSTRLKFLFQLLDRQIGARERVTGTLRSLVRDTEALDLFAETGLHRGAAFSQELVSRLFSRLLPPPPESRNLDDIFDRLFPRASDPDWLEQLDAETAAKIRDLFGAAPGAPEWGRIRADLEDALVLLADKICVIGSGREVRRRLRDVPFRELPFQNLPGAVEALLKNGAAGPGGAAAELNHVRGLIEGCHRALEGVAGQLEKAGVNTILVYDLERLQAQLRRLEMLLELHATPDLSPARTLMLVADLVRQNHAGRSVADLFRQNLHLLTRYIVERNAETGEHYVARTAREYAAMLRSAAGGGALMGVTTVVKLFLARLVLSQFFQGFAFGLNYAVSFAVIQLCGFTVATKQPASTAPSLARRMEELRTPSQIEALVDEIAFLIRSQIAAVFGNLACVIPATLFLDWIYCAARGRHLVDAHKAAVLLHGVSPLSGAWLYAAFTGVLLWASSLVAAWADNWFALHQLGPALALNRQLQKRFGPTRARRAARWLGCNLAGLAGNVSLGFMLGLAPEFAAFFGLPLDVRHVTLSTGQVTAAFAALGPASVAGTALETGLGLLGIAALNVFVSFGLALFVAIRARNVRGPERNVFLRALVRRIFTKPWTFLFPVGTSRGVLVEKPG